MDAPRFFQNPAFNEYVRLLAQQHRLIREGRDESPEGERLANAMDVPGSLLSREEVEEAQAISADFYQFSQPIEGMRDEPSPETKADLGHAKAAEPLMALRLLRQERLNGHQLASARAEAWRQLGEAGIALEYESLVGAEPASALPY